MNKVDWTKWSAIAEIVSSIAILITLIYLTIQTQQNSEAILASSRNAMIANDIAVSQQILENPSIELSWLKTSHTSEELSQLESWLIELVRTREHQWFQYRDGLLDEQIWEAYLTAVPVVLSYPITRTWWNFVKNDYFDHDFVQAMDERLREVPMQEDFRPTIERALEASGP